MRQLLFRLCTAADGRIYAFLTDQPQVEDFFDSGYKVAYKHRDLDSGKELLAKWRSSYTVLSKGYTQLPEENELPDDVQTAFNTMISSLIPGVSVFFCDYNLAIEADLPICNTIIEKYRSTDFVLFSCDTLIGNDPTTQPYMVSYALPRYPESGNTGSQHRIYCKTDSFAFARSINAILNQRERDDLNGGHIRVEIDQYIHESPVSSTVAEQVINRFIESLTSHSNNLKTLSAPAE